MHIIRLSMKNSLKPKCVVCGNNVTYRFYLCARCEKEYGKRRKDWPAWLIFLINDEAKERMREKRGYYDQEISFSDIPDIENLCSSDVM